MKRQIHSVLPLLTALPKPEKPKPPNPELEPELEELVSQFDEKPADIHPIDPWGLLKTKRGTDE